MSDGSFLASGQCLATGKVVDGRSVVARLECSSCRGRSPLRRRPASLVRSSNSGQTCHRPPHTAAPPCCPTTSARPFPGSSAKAVQFVCGRTNTSVPSGASTVSLSISNRAPPPEDDVELLHFPHLPRARAWAGVTLLAAVHAFVQRSDTEVVAHGPHVRVLAVRDVLQFIDPRSPIAHSSNPFSELEGHNRTESGS